MESRYEKYMPPFYLCKGVAIFMLAPVLVNHLTDILALKVIAVFFCAIVSTLIVNYSVGVSVFKVFFIALYVLLPFLWGLFEVQSGGMVFFLYIALLSIFLVLKVYIPLVNNDEKL